MLDLFAGSGALGIEALSRGASAVVAVEQDRATAATIERNAATCGVAAAIEVRVEPVLTALPRLAGREFDLVFLDPPYESGAIEPVLAALARERLVAADGIVVVEHGRRDAFGTPPGFARDLERRYGDSLLTLLRAPAPVALDEDVRQSGGAGDVAG